MDVTVPAAYGDVVSVGVGGSAQGGRAMVGFIAKIVGASTTNWRTWGAVIDASTHSIERYVPIQAVNRVITDPFPQGVAVNRISDHGLTDGWAMAWLDSRSNVSGGYSLWGVRVFSDGQRSQSQALEIAGTPGGIAWRGDPVIDGSGGRYGVAYRVRNDTIHVRRVDWPASSGTGSVGPRRDYIHVPLASNMHVNRYNIAFDRSTRDHWALVSSDPTSQGGTEITARRLGHTCGEVENAVTLSGTGTAADVCFDESRRDFQLVVHAGSAPIFRSYGLWLTHDPALGVSLYGTSCGGSSAASMPYAGRSDWSLQLTAAPFTPAALVLAVAPGSLPLGGGCFFNLDPSAVFLSLPAATNEFGIARAFFALPDWPVLIGDIYAQWGHLAGGQLRATSGLRARIRP